MAKWLTSQATKYTVLGVMVGLLFPLLASLIVVYGLVGRVTVQTIVAAHLTDPLLWIIDSAPFWLGIFARYAGSQRDNLLQAIDGGERRFQTIVNNAPIIIFAIDKAGMITLSEGQGLQALGHKPGEVVGQSVFKLYENSPAVLECV
ncbi:MAG: PAS domain-containing protein, partial [Anaerolineae bacterium]|nr:PAS domain-containing protein [Anaerolineae bacterium]